MTPFVIGFGGVLVGALLTGLSQIWKQVMDGRSAAKIIRMEMQDNVNRAALALSHGRVDVRMRDDAWQGHRVQLVPLLPAEVLLHMSITYAACWVIDDWITKATTKPKEAKEEVERWIENVMLDSAFLIQTAKRSRARQLLDVLIDKPSFAGGQEANEGTKEQFKEMRKKVMEAATPTPAAQQTGTEGTQP